MDTTPDMLAGTVNALCWLFFIIGGLVGIGLYRLVRHALDHMAHKAWERDTFRDLVEESRIYVKRLEEAKEAEVRG